MNKLIKIASLLLIVVAVCTVGLVKSGPSTETVTIQSVNADGKSGTLLMQDGSEIRFEILTPLTVTFSGLCDGCGIQPGDQFIITISGTVPPPQAREPRLKPCGRNVTIYITGTWGSITPKVDPACI